MTNSDDPGSGGAPLRLLARDSADIEVLSTLLQDAIVPGVDMLFDRDRKRFIFIANRFCWERPAIAEVSGEKGNQCVNAAFVWSGLKVCNRCCKTI